jgi:3-oxoadipate enol-lactonase
MSASGFVVLPEGNLYWCLQRAQVRSSPRPTLLFIHAGVADHTLWSEQIEYFSARGWDAIVYDIFGFGMSTPNDAFLKAGPTTRPKLKYHDHAARIAQHARCGPVVVVGLSMGGAIAIDFTLAYPDFVCGLVTIAGGLSGFQAPNTVEEDALFARLDRMMEKKDVEDAAKLNVRIWGDGPHMEEGRLDSRVRERLYVWCKDIARRESNSTGGFVFDAEDLEPTASQRLSEIRVPVAVGIGTMDETSTIAAMRYVAEHVSNCTVQEFPAAHMVNLEHPNMFNGWLDGWLHRFLDK